jgi:hypothetical protein
LVEAVHYSKNNDEPGRNSSSQALSDLYPDPRTLPTPPVLREPIPSVTLAELEPGKYISTTARIAYLRTAERHDALGQKVVFTGVLEDPLSKVSFVSHKISYPLIRDSVYKIHSAYVHEFPDRSLLLVITEFTKIDPKNVEDISEYTWKPKIDTINRPVRNIYLDGTVSTIYSTSGLIKRCNKCRSLIDPINNIHSMPRIDAMEYVNIWCIINNFFPNL